MFVFLSAASPWMCPGTVSTNSNTAGLLRELHLASLGMPKWLWRCNSLILGGEHCSSYCYGKSMWLSWRAASTDFSLSLSEEEAVSGGGASICTTSHTKEKKKEKTLNFGSYSHLITWPGALNRKWTLAVQVRLCWRQRCCEWVIQNSGVISLLSDKWVMGTNLYTCIQLANWHHKTHTFSFVKSFRLSKKMCFTKFDVRE